MNLGRASRRALAALLMLVVSAAGNTADQNGKYFVVFNQYITTCGKYLEARDQAHRGEYQAENAYNAWLLGFITGYNLAKPDTFNLSGGTDALSMLAWTENYCKTHPLEQFADAAVALAEALYPKRVVAAPKAQ